MGCSGPTWQSGGSGTPPATSLALEGTGSKQACPTWELRHDFAFELKPRSWPLSAGAPKGPSCCPAPPWELTWRRRLPHAPHTGGSCSSGWRGSPEALPCWGLRVRGAVWVCTLGHPATWGLERGPGAASVWLGDLSLHLPFRPPHLMLASVHTVGLGANAAPYPSGGDAFRGACRVWPRAPGGRGLAVPAAPGPCTEPGTGERRGLCAE